MAEQLAQRLGRTAIVDSDVLHQMVELEANAGDGRWLGALNACALAENFADAGCHVVVVETLSDELAEFYRAHLAEHQLRVVQLMPGEEEIHRRLISRTDYLARGDIDLSYAQQKQFTAYDELIDNTTLTPGDVAASIIEGLTATVNR